MTSHQKAFGQFFTPEAVARTLVRWVIRNPEDRLLDPSCGDGRFLVSHGRSVGVELDPRFAKDAYNRVPGALIHGGDFFRWASATNERFEAVAGNPPFIRYQKFAGSDRAEALSVAAAAGAKLTALTSSWAPFIIVAASLLRPGGRMCFVVPAEIGHATYARPLVQWLCKRFRWVQIIAYRQKLFPELSEDCWLLYCDDYGTPSRDIHVDGFNSFTESDTPPLPSRTVSLHNWESIGERLRPFLFPKKGIEVYQNIVASNSIRRFGELASASIGYVTGANDFFHLRPSEAKRWGISWEYLRVSVRKSEQLKDNVVDFRAVERWIAEDEPVLLLDLANAAKIPRSVSDYLETIAASKAQTSYKCRNRDPWYVVPDVTVPDAFLSVMSGARPLLVRNDAQCVCTNSLHAVKFRRPSSCELVQKGWTSTLTQLGAEIEGHPLGGGVLKIEPREAARIPIPTEQLQLTKSELTALEECLVEARSWRHHGQN
jgi:adenine-specific DNA-methyltransferase